MSKRKRGSAAFRFGKPPANTANAIADRALEVLTDNLARFNDSQHVLSVAKQHAAVIRNCDDYDTLVFHAFELGRLVSTVELKAMVSWNEVNAEHKRQQAKWEKRKADIERLLTFWLDDCPREFRGSPERLVRRAISSCKFGSESTIKRLLRDAREHFSEFERFKKLGIF